jgi:putative ABC transport system ATP-binding protein
VKARSGLVLDVQELSKAYVSSGGESVGVIDRVSFMASAGELIAMYGPSGSGKTTLLKLLARVLRPDHGTVLVRGRDIGDLEGAALDRFRLEELGLVLQSAQLIAGLTVVENAALRLMERGTRWREAEREVVPLLERLDLGRQFARRPAELSVGERQRVAIAMALSTGPSLVLADEPTGGLDSRRARIVLDLLAEVCREHGVAALITTHDPQATSVADRAWTLRDGHLREHSGDLAAQTSAAPSSADG